VEAWVLLIEAGEPFGEAKLVTGLERLMQDCRLDAIGPTTLIMKSLLAYDL
jgi:hypothetical protein